MYESSNILGRFTLILVRKTITKNNQKKETQVLSKACKQEKTVKGVESEFQICDI